MARRTNPLKIQLWKDRLTSFHDSGKTVAVFCQSLPCSVNSFYAWKRRIETAPEYDIAIEAPQKQAQKQAQKPAAFLPMMLRSTRELCVSIELPDGVSILVPCEATDAIRIVLERVA